MKDLDKEPFSANTLARIFAEALYDRNQVHATKGVYLSYSLHPSKPTFEVEVYEDENCTKLVTKYVVQITEDKNAKTVSHLVEAEAELNRAFNASANESWRRQLSELADSVHYIRKAIKGEPPCSK